MAGDSNVEKVKEKISINEVVGQYITLKKAGHNYTARCPFHNEKTPSFYVSPDRGTYMCFGCGERGDIFSFVEKMDGVDFATALRQLAEKAGVKLERQQAPNPAVKEKEEKLFEVCEAAVQFFESVLKEHKAVQDYLHSRGVQVETSAEWRIGYAPAAWDELAKHLVGGGFAKDDIVDAGFAVKSEKRPGEIFDRFRGRIIFPIFDATGRAIAVSGRFFERVPGQKADTEPAKYVNSPETSLFKKSKTLYGFDRAKGAIRKLDCILLVEGQFDLVLSHQSGLPFTVALSGTALTSEHLHLLGRLSKRLVLALDADAAGIRAGLKSAHMALKAGFDVKIPTFPQGEDPADLARQNPELLKAAVRTSKTAVEFFLDALRGPSTGGKPLDERAYKKAVEAQVLPLIAAIESSIEQEHFVRIVAGKLGVSEAAVRIEVAKVPALPQEAEASPAIHQEDGDATSGFERKVGMLLFHFGRESEVGHKLAELLGKEKLDEIGQELAPRAEELRFRFDTEVGDHSSEEAVAADMLGSLEKVVTKARFKMKFV